MTEFSLADLEKKIAERANDTPENSYTRTLLDGGVKKCAAKFGEEATEAIIAAMVDDDKAVIAETADTLYHLLVLLHSRQIQLDAVLDELNRRTAMSGIAEKQTRR